MRAETLDDLFEMFRTQYLAVHNSKSDNEITTYLYKDHVHDLLGHRKINEITWADVNQEHDFYDAVDAKKKAGWKSQKIDGEWCDFCTDCQEG